MRKRRWDPEDVVFGSTEEYFHNSSDMPSWKIHMRMSIDQEDSMEEGLIIDRERYMATKLSLYKEGIITESQYAQNSWAEYLGMLHKYEILPGIPSKIDDYIKVIPHQKDTLLQRIQLKIRPEEKFKKQKLRIVGEKILGALKKSQ